ncbi:hypothetical protein [Streptomyces viridochromogenes]|uniref:Uncharacterized protein n=1 Tax=Streptomyces viridochromogenes Tue57 TaxID=1160705 RepID=L8PP06_STRVR|nr:hypothetical protein [Streptomyces viridochromogenes]ELS57814.1 hypothetical protein STVIR_1238 [Streptomyces viridochromogenes Tue57]
MKDLLLHPDSGKPYAGSEGFVDTGDVNERGLYALDATDGKVLTHLSQAHGAGGTMAARNVALLAAPLPGDGVVFHYPLRGIGTAKDGDTGGTGGAGGSGTSTTGGGTGGSRGTGTSTAGGSLASTGVTVLWVAALAAALPAAGWAAYRRGRTVG